MKIKLSKTLGYCLGVRRAMNAAFKQLSQRNGPVYSHGELIHNGPALDLLAQKGLRLWQGETEGSLIIRAHGLPPDQLERLKKSKMTISDATCPRVLQVQKLAAQEAGNGRMVIIWGKADHPEVIGIIGHAAPKGHVVANVDEIDNLPEADDVLLIAQTTQNLSQWPEIVDKVLARWPSALVKNTICEATEQRQAEVARLVQEVQALVVVGGKTSGNTARLADIGRRAGLKTILVETVDDLALSDFQDIETVGVVAGASTSAWQISQVVQALAAMARSMSDCGGFWPRLLRGLVLSNIFSALGIASLTLTAQKLMGATPSPIIFSFFFFLVISLFIFSDILQGASQTLRFNDPDRTAFFNKYNQQLKIFAIFSWFMSFLAAYLAGPSAVVLFAMVWLAALVYRFTPRPKGYNSLGLPRTLLGPIIWASGWGLIAVLACLPSVIAPALSTATLTAGAVFSHIFVIGLTGDVIGAQGDRFFGRSTLPTVFGEKATARLLLCFLLAWSFWLIIGYWSNALPSLACFLIFSGPIYNLLLIKPLFRNPGLKGFGFEALMQGQMMLSALVAILWSWT